MRIEELQVVRRLLKRVVVQATECRADLEGGVALLMLVMRVRE